MSANFSIGGLASGIDTNSLISELLRIERQPIRTLQTQQQQFQAKIDAFSDITTRLSALRDATNGLRELSDFAGFRSVTSSNESIVSATVTGTPQTGSTSFTVNQLATQHQVASSDTFSSSSATVGAGTVTLTIGGTDYDITTSGTTTIADLAASINNLDAGVSAQVLQTTDSSTFQLVVTSEDTGADAAFTASSTAPNLTGFVDVQTAQDAQITIGSGANAITVNRSSNTVNDLIEGVTLNLLDAPSTGNSVTVNVGRDVDGAVEAISGFVDELNALISASEEASAYDIETETSNPLTGDSTIRQLILDLRSAVSNPVSSLSGTYSFASQVGVELQRDGTFQLNESELRNALNTDFDAVADLFARAGSTSDSRVAFSGSSDATISGSYLVQISQAAKIAAVTGTVAVPPPSDPQQFIVTTPDGQTVTVSVPADSDATAVVNAINAALAAANVSNLAARVTEPGQGAGTPQVSDDVPGEFVIESTAYGSGTNFTIADDPNHATTGDTYGIYGTYSGQDVVGTINGEAATGTGRSLRSTTGDAEGLRLTISATQDEVDAAGGTLSLGSVTYSEGIAGTLSDVLARYEGSDGLIAQASDGVQSTIDVVQERIDDYEYRITQREITLRRQFTAMENAIASLQQQSSFLFSQLSGFQAT